MIDIHAHTSDKEMWELHTRSASLDTLEQYAEEYSVEKIVIMATYFPFKGGGLPNRELLRRIGDREKFLAFISLDAMNNLENGIRELHELAGEKKVAGIKLYPGYQDFHLSDERVFPIYELARDMGLPIAVHSGELHHCCQKDTDGKRTKCGGRCYIDELGDLSRPRAVAKAAENFPEVNFVMCHMGNPFFSELRDVMRQYPNVHTDISGQFVSGTHEDTPEFRSLFAQEMREFLKLEQGSERIMFGSDFPIQSYKDSVELIESLGLSMEIKEKIFHQNARSILRL